MRRTENEIPRDRWGRPKIEGKSYTRASTLAGYLDDTSGLTRWKLKMAILGLSRSPELMALASTTRADDSAALADIVERAHERAGANEGRDLGTAIHQGTEIYDFGLSTDVLPWQVRNAVRGYAALLEQESVEAVLAETFVLNDPISTAGSLDRIIWDVETNEYRVMDIKTGKETDPKKAARFSGLSWAIQMSIYAHGEPWDGKRLEWRDLSIDPPKTDRGLVVYINRESGQCWPIWVDLVKGWEAAQLAAQVRDMRKAKVTL